MITANRLPAQLPPRWQQLWRESVTDPLELLRLLGLEAQAGRLLPDADTGFALRVPRGFVARMRPGDPDDPLLRQVLPLAAELAPQPGFAVDAVGDLAARSAHGVLQKYAGRALLIATGSCAVNCRYCFRREFPYAQASLTPQATDAALQAVATDTGIGEVILSGGDPLSLGDRRLATLLAAIGRIPHIRRIRIHTRVPVVLPERVDGGLLGVLAQAPRPLVVVLHANHAQELDAAVAQAAAGLRGVCATVLNQSVLLRGVNDSAPALIALSERLFAAGVLPYYLHLLDPVRGAAHFRVGERRARRIMGAVAAALPGYLVPRLARERPGMPAKEVLAPALHNREEVT